MSLLQKFNSNRVMLSVAGAVFFIGLYCCWGLHCGATAYTTPARSESVISLTVSKTGNKILDAVGSQVDDLLKEKKDLEQQIENAYAAKKNLETADGDRKSLEGVGAQIISLEDRLSETQGKILAFSEKLDFARKILMSLRE